MKRSLQKHSFVLSKADTIQSCLNLVDKFDQLVFKMNQSFVKSSFIISTTDVFHNCLNAVHRQHLLSSFRQDIDFTQSASSLSWLQCYSYDTIFTM